MSVTNAGSSGGTQQPYHVTLSTIVRTEEDYEKAQRSSHANINTIIDQLQSDLTQAKTHHKIEFIDYNPEENQVRFKMNDETYTLTKPDENRMQLVREDDKDFEYLYLTTKGPHKGRLMANLNGLSGYIPNINALPKDLDRTLPLKADQLMAGIIQALGPTLPKGFLRVLDVEA